MITRVILIISLICTIVTMGCNSDPSVIVFTSDRDGSQDIYSLILNEGNMPVNLTATTGREYDPVLSQDRKFISFLSEINGNVTVYVMGIDGSGAEAVTQGMSKYSSQRWSPSNDRIVYVQGEGAKSKIYVTWREQEKTALLTSIEGVDVGDWSSDGEYVAFTVLGGEDQGIWIRNPDGVNLRKLGNATSTPDHSPIFSPDSKYIAFISERDGNSDIYITETVDEGGGKFFGRERRLTQSDAEERELSWSPNSEWIAFTSGIHEQSEIYKVRIKKNGGRPIQLTFNSVRDKDPAWSPNGDSIAFVSDLDGDSEIFIMSSDGKNQNRLTNNDAADTSPTW